MPRQPRFQIARRRGRVADGRRDRAEAAITRISAHYAEQGCQRHPKLTHFRHPKIEPLAWLADGYEVVDGDWFVALRAWPAGPDAAAECSAVVAALLAEVTL